LNDEGFANVTDQTLMKVIESGNGSARDILDTVVSIVLKAKRAQFLEEANSPKEVV
jgi:hypothetical protein